MQIFDTSPVIVSELIGPSGTFNIDNSMCSGIMMIRSIRDYASIISFQLQFKKHGLITLEFGESIALDCFDSAQGLRIQDGDRVRMMPGRIYSCAGNTSVKMLFSADRTIKWHVAIINPDRYIRYMQHEYPDVHFDITTLLQRLDGCTFYDELLIVFAQLMGRPNTAAPDMYYESKFNEMMAWLIEYGRAAAASQQGRLPSVSAEDRQSILKIAESIRRSPGSSLSLDDAAASILMSTSKFRKDFKAVMGCSMSEFRNQERMRLALFLLSETALSCKEVAERLGYRKLENFNLFFRKAMQMTPREYRQLMSNRQPESAFRYS